MFPKYSIPFTRGRILHKSNSSRLAEWSPSGDFILSIHQPYPISSFFVIL